MKILVVDDEQDVLDLFRDIFLKKDYEVRCAQGGRAALKLIDEDRPDVTLLDVKMPEIGGIETLEQIKKKDPSIEVVMLTAYGYEDKLINEAMQKGATGYISKNLPLQQIINTFNTLLKSMSINRN